MKRGRLFFISALLFAAASSTAWADHIHYGARVGIYVGPSVGWYYPPPYPAYPYYYGYPAVVAVPDAPTYIEQGPASPEPAQPPSQAPSDYWYYCSNPNGYYPYIKQCPGGWQRVEPRPPSQP